MTALGTEFAITIPLPNLRNGNLSEITAVVPSSSIPVQYQWLGIAGLPEARAVAFLEILARGYFTMLRTHDTAMPAETARAQAIVLASVRTGLRTMWKLTPSDLSESETAPGYLSYRAPRKAVAATDNTAAVAEVTEGVVTSFTGGTANAATTAWASWTALTADEQLVATHMVSLAIAVLPVQGWSLVKTGHHYLSDGPKGSKAAWVAVVKQFDGKLPLVVKTWVDTRASWWSDIAFHKAGHPIAMALKIEIAGASATPAKLRAAGFGSAAVRLPATDPAFEYAKLVMAVLTKTSGTLSALGAQVNMTALAAAVNAVTATDVAEERAALIAHATSLAHSQDPSVAIAAGVLVFLTEDQSANTLTKSYGFKRLIQDYPAEVHQGKILAQANNRRQREAIESGNPIDIKINFGEVRT